MSHKATFVIDEDHLKRHFREWIVHVSKGRKYEPLLCFGIFLLGLIALVRADSIKPVDFFGVGASVVLFVSYLKFKRDWLRTARSSKRFASRIALEIRVGRIIQLAPTIEIPEEECLISSIVFASEGFFVSVKEGSLYVPYDAFQPPLTRDELQAQLPLVTKQ